MNSASLPGSKSCVSDINATVVEVPKGWVIVRFRDLFYFGKGLNITKENLQPTGVPCVNYGEVHSKYSFEVNPREHKLHCVSEDYLKKCSQSLLNRGDFVFADTSEDIDGSGNFTQLVSDDTVFAGYHTVICSPIGGNDSRYLAYFLDSESYRNQIRKAVKGVKVYSITKAILKNTKVWLPSVREQMYISGYLNKKAAQIKEAIAIKEQQIALLKERKQIIIQKAVTQGLDPSVPMKDSGVDWIGQIPAHWKVIKLKYLFDEVNNRSKTGMETLFSLRMDIGLVPHDDVSDKHIPAESLVDYKIVDSGQMVMNRMRAAIGIFGLATDYGLVSPDYAVFDVVGDVVPDYYLTLFKLPLMGTQFRLASKGMGTGSSGFMRLYTDEFGDIKVANPPKEEQETLMRFIEETSTTIALGVEHLQSQIEKLKEYKTTLINSAVTGKIKITPEMLKD